MAECARLANRSTGSRGSRAGCETLGLRTGDRVAILASNSDYYHEALLACWWFGAVASPVNSRWSTAEITYALEDSGSTVLLVDENFASVGSTLREACPGLTTVVYCGNDRVPDGSARLRTGDRGGDSGRRSARRRRHACTTPVIHRRDHRSAEGRDDQPSSADDLGAEHSRGRRRGRSAPERTSR